ncbi:MAG: protoporphyrinogen oxidase [Myxococcota bacterium]
MSEVEIAVVGGGIAGLSCATELAAHGSELVVLEAERRVGGPAETRRMDKFLLERGPNTVRSSPELEDLIEHAGLSLLRARRGAPFLVSDGRLIRLPPSPRELLRGIPLPSRGWLELLGEPFRPRHRPPTTVRAFVETRLGPTVAEHLADLLTLGVYGASADRIGFESAYPELARRLERHGSLLRTALTGRRPRGAARSARGLISTPAGLAALPERLAERLGSQVRLRTPVRSVRRGHGVFELLAGESGEEKLSARRVVLAVPPHQAAKLLAGTPAARPLSRYRSTPQTLASFAIEEATCVERWAGFGFLAPSREGLPLLGGLFPSFLFPGRAPRDTLLVVVFVGPALVDETDATLASELGALLQRLLRSTQAPILLDVARHPQGIVLYDRRHRDRTRIARRELEAIGGLQLAGAAYDGVGFGKAAASGRAAARTLLELG